MLIPFLLNNCVFYDIQYKGVFENSYKYHEPRNNYPKETKVIMEDDTEISFGYLGGHCGAGIEFVGIILPIIPFYNSNTCEENGFMINYGAINKMENKKISCQLKYNNTIYSPIDNGTKFHISDFKTFKKAEDKTLIIHKKTTEGKIITKEIPFEWKITTHTVVIP